jgi:hypothetical protein
MNITNATYLKNQEGENSEIKATIDGKEMYVPLDTDNRHYQAIQEWVAIEGNEIIDNGGGE